MDGIGSIVRSNREIRESKSDVLGDRLTQYEAPSSGVNGAGSFQGREGGFQCTDPPLLIGGLIHGESEPISVALDFLTVTVSSKLALKLIKNTKIVEEGNSVKGFKQSEKRECVGGTVWRRWDPQRPSKRWDKDYESWEFDGKQAKGGAELLRMENELKVTRVDIAFDYQVKKDCMSDDLVELMKDHAEKRGIVLGITGAGGVNTRYLGSFTSERMARIYRKDLHPKGGKFWELLFGPTLRVELVLKQKHAVAFWKVFASCPEKSKLAAAAHLKQMGGLDFLHDCGEVPEVEVPEVAAEVEALHQFLSQWGGRVEAWQQSGIDVGALCAKHVRQASSRNVVARMKTRKKAILAAGPQQVVRGVQMLFGWA